MTGNQRAVTSRQKALEGKHKKSRLHIIDHVPARVCQETGEQFFSPETVERIQALIKGGRKPSRVIETPVFEYA